MYQKLLLMFFFITAGIYAEVKFEAVKISDEGFIKEILFTISRYTLCLDNEGFLQDIEVNASFHGLSYYRRETDYFLDLDYPHNSCYFSNGILYKVEDDDIRYIRNRVEYLGKIRIQYLHNRISKIGSINLEYDDSSNRITFIGNVQVKYDSQTNKVISVISYPCTRLCVPEVVIINKRNR
jgi:hypothetical protein